MSVSDLTGTKWVVNSTIAAPAGYGEFSISWEDGLGDSHTEFNIGYGLYGRPAIYGAWAGAISDNGVNIAFNNAWFLENPITITGGTDVPNPDLISWLEANATQQSSQLSVDLSTLSGWSDVSAGSHTLKVKAKATGYRDSALSAGVSFEKAPGIIEFTISGTTYQAESGMTWGAWVLSEYNTAGYYIYSVSAAIARRVGGSTRGVPPTPSMELFVATFVGGSVIFVNAAELIYEGQAYEETAQGPL